MTIHSVSLKPGDTVPKKRIKWAWTSCSPNYEKFTFCGLILKWAIPMSGDKMCLAALEDHTENGIWGYEGKDF